MAAISTGMQTSFEKSVISDVVNRICDNIGKAAKDRILPWIPEIEEYTKHLIENLRQKDAQRRKADVLLAAAVYDAFLEFESRTRTSVGLPIFEKALDLRACSINSTWTKLFDSRTELSLELLDTVYLQRDQAIEEGIHLIINKLERAGINKTTQTTEWLQVIQKNALELYAELSNGRYSEFDPMVIAVVLIYAAMKFHHGKMAIKIAQKNLADLSGFSTSQVSKCWVNLFGS